MDCPLEFELLHNKIWNYYGVKNGFQRELYNLHIITGVKGPRVKNTKELNKKKDLFVLFERKSKVVFKYKMY